MYRIELVRSVFRDLRRLPPKHLRQVRDKVDLLAANPNPQDSIRLKGEPSFRVAVGEYRIVYDVDHRKQVVTVLRIKHRREAYRRR